MKKIVVAVFSEKIMPLFILSFVNYLSLLFIYLNNKNYIGFNTKF